ncbi:unnamed protein product, partial [Adineta ricciae]
DVDEDEVDKEEDEDVRKSDGEVDEDEDEDEEDLRKNDGEDDDVSSMNIESMVSIYKDQLCLFWNLITITMDSIMI